MAVAFDSSISTDVGGNSSSFSNTGFGFTVGTGANRALVATMIWNRSLPSGISITWNGVACTLLTTINGSTTSGAIFGLLNPASGALTLAGSWTGAGPFCAMGVSFTGVNQTSIAAAFPNNNTASGTGTSAA